MVKKCSDLNGNRKPEMRKDGANRRVVGILAVGKKLGATINVRARALATFGIIAQRRLSWECTSTVNVRGSRS